MAAQRPRKDDLSFVCYVILEDGRNVPFEELTPEEHQRFRENAAKRLSDRMSAYYTQHPEEYQKLKSLE